MVRTVVMLMMVGCVEQVGFSPLPEDADARVEFDTSPCAEVDWVRSDNGVKFFSLGVLPEDGRCAKGSAVPADQPYMIWMDSETTMNIEMSLLTVGTPSYDFRFDTLDTTQTWVSEFEESFVGSIEGDLLIPNRGSRFVIWPQEGWHSRSMSTRSTDRVFLQKVRRWL